MNITDPFDRSGFWITLCNGKEYQIETAWMGDYRTVPTKSGSHVYCGEFHKWGNLNKEDMWWNFREYLFDPTALSSERDKGHDILLEGLYDKNFNTSKAIYRWEMHNRVASLIDTPELKNMFKSKLTKRIIFLGLDVPETGNADIIAVWGDGKWELSVPSLKSSKKENPFFFRHFPT